MRRTGPVPWLCLAVWSAWLFGLQGLVASSAMGRWAPDLGLCLLLALGARCTPGRMLWIACWIALARIAFSSDPPLAILVGYLGVTGLFTGLRGALQVEGGLLAALFGGACALCLSGFWTYARFHGVAFHSSLLPSYALAWRSALATAILALFLLPSLARLPGLGPLGRRRG